jgi:hypothetical protein
MGSAWTIHGDTVQGDGTLHGAAFNNIDHEGNLLYEPLGNGSNLPAAVNTDIRLGDNDHVGTDFVDPQYHHNTIVSIGTNHTGNNGGSQTNAYPGMINVEQAGSPAAAGWGSTSNFLINNNYIFSDSTTFSATQRMVFGVYYGTHTFNLTYTIGANNVYMWDGTNWPTTLP